METAYSLFRNLLYPESEKSKEPLLLTKMGYKIAKKLNLYLSTYFLSWSKEEWFPIPLIFQSKKLLIIYYV